MAGTVLALDADWSFGEAYLAVLGIYGKGGGPSITDVGLPTRYLVVMSGFAGIVLRGIVLAFIVDMILRVRLPMMYKRKGKRMTNHVILCGFGRIGYRVASELERLDQDVVVIEADPDGPFVKHAGEQKIPIIFDDPRNPGVLASAGIENAQAVIACTDDDLVNLEIALDAREMHPGIRVVVRIFDQSLAKKISQGFDIQTAFSSSALSAPAFATAAVDRSVKGSFYVDDKAHVYAKFRVPTSSTLGGETVRSIRDKYAVNTLMIEPSNGEKAWAPHGEEFIPPGGIVHMVGPFDELSKLKRDHNIGLNLASY
jgi:Trk K+ transport system NAD-binding subunit